MAINYNYDQAVDGVTDASADYMNNMQEGIKKACDKVDDISEILNCSNIGIDLKNKQLNFYVGGHVGFYIKNSADEYLSLYNHDNKRIAKIDYHGNLHITGKVFEETV